MHSRPRRPFGDLLTKGSEKGGLDIGTFGSSAVLAAVSVILIIYSSMTEYRANNFEYN